MKTLVSLILFFSFTKDIDVDKQTLSYAIVTSKSDLIVEGKINEIFDGKYNFTVQDYLKGNSPEIIKVNKWKEWICDSRQIKHEIGQNLILFLQKNNKGEYNIINGSTGELIINNDGNILRDKYQKLPNQTTIKEGVKLLLKSIRYTGELYYGGEFEVLVNKTEFEKMRKENEFYFKSTVRIEYQK